MRVATTCGRVVRRPYGGVASLAVPRTCLACGHYRLDSRCEHCGVATPARLPALVVTGAAGSGKSTVCAALAGLPGFVFLDGDVLAAGASAVDGSRRDYEAFWHHVLAVAAEVAANDLIPVIGCICLPAQVLASSNTGLFTRIGFLALVQEPAGVERRLAHRLGEVSARQDLGLHQRINDELARTEVPSPHVLHVLDTTAGSVDETVAEARHWVLAHREQRAAAAGPVHAARRPRGAPTRPPPGAR